MDRLEDRCDELQAKQGDIDKEITLLKREVIKREREKMRKEKEGDLPPAEAEPAAAQKEIAETKVENKVGDKPEAKAAAK